MKHTLLMDLTRAPAVITVQRGACAFGALWLARTQQGICQLEFILEGNVTAAEATLAKAWPGSSVVHSDEPIDSAALLKEPQVLHLRGTAFQQRVWAVLVDIPVGHTTTYGAVAARIGSPAAYRAVGSAIGKNPVALLIPCHRVLAANGNLGGFYWGPELKRQLLAAEGVVV